MKGLSSNERNYFAAGLLWGGSAGLGAGYLLARLLLRRTVAARVARELEAEDAHRRSRTEAPSSHHDALIRDVTVGRTGNGPFAPGRAVLDLQGRRGNEDEVRSGEDVVGVVAPQDGDWPPLDRDTSKPYLISVLEFADLPEYNKISVTWHQADDVFVDDHENPIRNYHDLVGPIGYRTFGGPSEDEHIAYIRNEKMLTDFEISRNFSSYADAILNYGRPL